MNEKVSSDKLAADVRTVIGDAEELLRQSAASTGEQAIQLRERAMALLRDARERAYQLQDKVVVKGRAAAHAADDYVHENPWRSIGVALGIGLVVGLLVNRAR